MYTQTMNYLKEQGIEDVQIAIILGSGLGDLAEQMEERICLPYEDIPNFPTSTVEGHSGRLVYGRLAGKMILALQGRFHYYEGYDLAEVTYPVRIFKELGVEQLIVTNAAGGVNEHFAPGDLMLITDHINLVGANPLRGANVNMHGPRFVDMTQGYSRRGQDIARKVAKELDIILQEGVYTWFSGPTYETPAEIQMTRVIGGDAVGMSTVPEVIVANHCGMEVLGFSCITNYAAGMQESLNHEEVVTISKEVKPKFEALIKGIISQL